MSSVRASIDVPGSIAEALHNWSEFATPRREPLAIDFERIAPAEARVTLQLVDLGSPVSAESASLARRRLERHLLAFKLFIEQRSSDARPVAPSND